MNIIVLYLFIKPFISFLDKINTEFRLYPKWIWIKNKNINNIERIECEKDYDCPFPSACCNEPFFPVQFCCNNWNKRYLEYAYIKNYIKQK